MQDLGQSRTPSRSLRTGLEGFLVTMLLVIFVLMELSGIQDKSLTFDEISHLTAGYSYWTTQDYRLQPENGIFPQRWVALPLLAMDLQFPSRQQQAWWNSELFEFSDQFFHSLGNDGSVMLWRGRIMSIILAVVLGGIVFVWARWLQGPGGGLLALLLFTFSPTVLAHGRLATSDLAIALGFTAWLAISWQAFHRLTPLNVLLSGVIMGLALVSKMSGILVFPLVAVLFAIRVIVGRPLIVHWRRVHVLRRRWQQIVACTALLVGQLAIATCLVWALFGFRYQVFQDFEPGRDTLDWLGRTTSLDSQRTYETERWPVAGLTGSMVHLARQYRLLPEGYLYGLAFTLATVEGHEDDGYAFLRGRHSQQGWAIFFPYCFLVKTPLAILAMLILAAAAARTRFRENCATQGAKAARRGAWRALYRAAPLWLFLAAYWAAAVTSSFNLGQRHLLPTYPLLFILAGSATFWFRNKHIWPATCVVAVSVLVVVSSWNIRPHYLAYFNRLVGGPRQGYRHLVDSSLDWGQDLPGLRDWLEREVTNDEPVYLSYFGTGKPNSFGIEARQLPSLFGWKTQDEDELIGGIYCISATMLQCVYPRVPRGPWAESYEQLYQASRTEVLYFRSRQRQLSREGGTLGEAELQQWNQERERFHSLRFARLCSFLRQREPDDHVGYSMLIYRLSNSDVRQALHGPPAEKIPDLRREKLTRD